MSKLKDFEGKLVHIIFISPKGTFERIKTTLASVDDAGIWVEHQELTNEVLADLKLPASPTVVRCFYPYAALHAIFVQTPGLSLSEKAFGA